MIETEIVRATDERDMGCGKKEGWRYSPAAAAGEATVADRMGFKMQPSVRPALAIGGGEARVLWLLILRSLPPPPVACHVAEFRDRVRPAAAAAAASDRVFRLFSSAS